MERALKYEALAELFTLPVASPERAIQAVVDGCTGCPYEMSSEVRTVRDAGFEALAWYEHYEDCEGVARDYVRMFGKAAPPGTHSLPVPPVPPFESAYIEGDVSLVAEDLVRQYRSVGYWMALDEPNPPLPSHISHELAFLGHCLSLGALKVPEIAVVAREFFHQHLAQWAIVFGAAVASSARTPVLRFAGIALEQFIVCESQTFRGESVVPAIRC